jgi:hypothetical protein
MAKHVTLQSADTIKEIVSAVSSASDELSRLSLEVSQILIFITKKKFKFTYIIFSDFQ